MRTKTRLLSVLFTTVAALLLSGCGQGPEHKLVVTGSSTVAPVMSEIARDFEQKHPDIQVDVQSGGSSRGIADVERGTADIGMASRDLRPGEDHLTAHTIARDGITMIVHTDNPITSLSRDTIRRIYQGEIEHWSEIGAYDQPISVVHKSEGRATLAVFLDYMGLDNQSVEPDMIVGENQQAIQSVAGNPGAIGYVSIGAAEHESGRGVSMRPVAINGVRPDPGAVADGSFPLTRNLNLITNGNAGPEARKLIDYARSTAAATRIHNHFFIPVAQ